VILLFFSVVDPSTFKNLLLKWIPEVKRFAPRNIPRVLVGLHKSLRQDGDTIKGLEKSGQKPTTELQALELANDIDAQSYVECDALTNENITVPFEQVSVNYLC